MDRDTEREIQRIVSKEIDQALKKIDLNREMDKIIRMIKDTERSIRKDMEYQSRKEHDNLMREIEKRIKK